MNRTSLTRLDPRTPLVIDTRELGRRPGSMRRLDLTVPAPAGLAIEVIGVPRGAPVQVTGRLEAVMEGVLVSGTVQVPLAGECSRCLDPIAHELQVEIQELFAYPDSSTMLTTDDDETPRLTGDLLDLEPVLRDAVVLALPLTPRCREDCPGLCADCGARLADAGPDHGHEVADPRWAGLEQLYSASDAAPGQPHPDQPHSSQPHPNQEP